LFYLQRSCDFSKYWLTDVWMARQFQKSVLELVNQEVRDEIHLGSFTHFIISFHRFLLPGEEDY